MSRFHDAVERILNSWTVLKLAIEHGFGGADTMAKALWLVDAVDQWFQENSGIESFELEDFLTNILNNEFDTIAEDGSLQVVCNEICGCYHLCQQGKHDELESRLARLPQANVSQCVQHKQEQEGDEEENEEMDVHPSTSSHETQSVNPSTSTNAAVNGETSEDTPMEAEEDDGWTVVKKGKR